MIKNIIFDIGNVLAAFRWKDYIADLGYTGEIAERLANATVKGPVWNELDRGATPLDDIIVGMIALDPELEKEIRHFFEDRRPLVTEYAYSEAWLKELKSRGYKIYLLSNYMKDHFEYISSNYKFFGNEDGMVISYREKVLKPGPEIYNILLSRYQLNPSECVFLDDTAANIAGAEAMGIKGIVFRGYEDGRAKLEELLAQNKLQ